jgi:hypothetical protein
MRLHEVTLSDLSPLRHTIRLTEAEGWDTPEFMVISYTGDYRYGSAGAPDARCILATAEAAHRAWYSQAIVLDFSRLSYQWGDEMEWVLGIGGRTGECAYPLVIVVGDGCRAAMITLLEDEYAPHCVESLPEAYLLGRRKIEEYDRCLKAHRGGE